MSQTWDFTYYVSIISGAGVGDTLSEGVGAGGETRTWDFTYVSVIIPATGAGDTLSEGVGAAKIGQAWDFTYWDGVPRATGEGNTDSTGVGAATALGAATWYAISGTALPAPAATGSGNTDSTGVGAATGIDPYPDGTGFGDTLSEGGNLPLGTVVPPGGIRLSPYWEPGEYVYCYLLRQWLGSYEAKLNAGHGPLVTTGVADPDATVVLTGLAPGEYVAVDGRKRVHFVITP